MQDELFLAHPSAGWALDLTRAHLALADLDALPWRQAFDEMTELERGAIANPDEQRQVGHYWLRAPDRAPTIAQGQAIGETREAVLSFAASVRSGAITAPDGSHFTDVIHVGIGGSALGPQLLVDALGDDRLDLHFVDNIDPDGVARVIRTIGDRLRSTLVVAVSKSGGTSETKHGLELVCRAITERGLELPGRLVAVTGEDSALDRRAVQEGWLKRFAMWDWVGGRTSVTSAVGLLPGALAGLDMPTLLDGAAFMDAWTRSERWSENPAALLAGAWHVLGHGRGDRAMVVLPYNDRLILFSRYLQQLIMESLGKRLDRQGNEVHQGLAVYGNKGSTDQHSFVQQLRDGRNDFLALLVGVLSDGRGDERPVEGQANAGDVLQGFLLGTRRALDESGRPTLLLTVPKVDEAVLGGLIALFERAVGLYASLIDINAYHQPGVEAGKKAARAIVGLQAAVAEALSDNPIAEADVLTQVRDAGHQAGPIEVWAILHRLERTHRATRTSDGWTT